MDDRHDFLVILGCIGTCLLAWFVLCVMQDFWVDLWDAIRGAQTGGTVPSVWTRLYQFFFL